MLLTTPILGKPATIVQGCYNVICRVRSTFHPAAGLPETDLKVALVGHSVMDAAIIAALVSVTDATAMPQVWGCGKRRRDPV